MDKPMNRIKEVLEEKGIKQTWLAEKLGKSFLHCKFLCL
jgi:putative transcriptional regulator